MRKNKINLSQHLLAIYLFIFFIFFTFLIYKYNQNLQINNLRISNFKSNFKSKINIETLEAKSYIIANLKTNEIINSENENLTLPLASLSKVISIGAYLDYKKEKNEEINIETLEKIKNILIASDNKSLEDLGEKFAWKNKISLLEIVRAFIAKNNIQANEMKMQNLTGLDIDDKSPSNIATAKSFAKLYAQIYNDNKQIFENTKFENLKENKQNFVNTNTEVEKTFGLLSSKTGFTDLAGGNLSVIVSPAPDEKYLIVVLGSSKEGRFRDVAKLNNLLPLMIKSQ